VDIAYVKSAEIDHDKWDTVIKGSPNDLPYAYSWYLDVVSPSWDALILGDYQIVMPLPWNAKWLGARQVYQPILTQQLGIFGQDISEELITAFWQIVIARFKLIQLSIYGHVPNGLGLTKWIKRTNYELPLDLPYEQIQAGYARSLRKRLRQAATHLTIQKEDMTVHTLIQIYQRSVGHKVDLSTADYNIIADLLSTAIRLDHGYILSATTSRGEDVGGLFILTTPTRCINLFGASTEAGRQSYAMHLLLDSVIRQWSDTQTIMDFEGSDISGIAQFFQSFGATDQPYTHITVDQTPWWWRSLRSIKSSIAS